MGLGPAVAVRAPAAGPPKFGLLVSSRQPEDEAARWGNGFDFEPEGCASGQVDDPCAPSTFTAGRPPDEVDVEPVMLTAGVRCTTIGYRAREWEALGRRIMESQTETLLGDELWNGTRTQASGWPNRWLADVANVDILTETGPVGLTHGLACLEQYLAENNGGQQGMIHATAQVVTHWRALGLVIPQPGGVIETALGTIVVPSPGYDGSDPDGNPASDGDVWAYATDLVKVRIGPIEVIDPFSDMGPGVDRDNNTVEVIARRLAAAYWENCRHAGARLDVVTCGIGGS